MGDAEVLMGFQEGFAEADYVDVLLEKEVGEFGFFILDALGIPG